MSVRSNKSSFGFWSFFDVLLDEGPCGGHLVEGVFLSIYLVGGDLSVCFALLIIIVLATVTLITMTLKVTHTVSPHSCGSRGKRTCRYNVPAQKQS